MKPLESFSVEPPTIFEANQTTCVESKTADSGPSRPWSLQLV